MERGLDLHRSPVKKKRGVRDENVFFSRGPGTTLSVRDGWMLIIAQRVEAESRTYARDSHDWMADVIFDLACLGAVCPA